MLRTLRTGLIDAVQVVYNVFDQSPEDELFPLCRELGVAVIARVPLDEGSLAGTLTLDSRWPDGDWRNSYFGPAALAATIPRVEALRPLVPEGETMAQLALRFILSNPDVTTVIPGRAGSTTSRRTSPRPRPARSPRTCSRPSGSTAGTGRPPGPRCRSGAGGRALAWGPRRAAVRQPQSASIER